MASFVSEWAHLPLDRPCPLATIPRPSWQNHHQHPLRLPAAPQPRLLELPSDLELSPLNLNSSPPFLHESAGYLYPLNLSSPTTLGSLTAAQRATLWEINLCLPLHLHTPDEHIGTIFSQASATSSFDVHGHQPMSPSHQPPTTTLSAADVLLFLQDFVVDPLDLQPTFLDLHTTTQDRVQDAFYDRILGTGDLRQVALCDTVWSNFVNGYLDSVGVRASQLQSGPLPSTPSGRPLGLDLLLGNWNVWGFDNVSQVGGYDIIHLDCDPGRSHSNPSSAEY